MAPSHWHLLSWILTLVGLGWFSTAFFLAKRSLPHSSTCDEACSLLAESLGIEESECQMLKHRSLIASENASPRNGCWINRRVHSMVYIVVDALRFDFALYDLPRSLGRRMAKKEPLFQFVADPPTVTMQRLKALTTGGLPTFAEFSTNLGGASVEEDSWLRLMHSTPWQHRGLQSPSQAAFVGDDTWVDLYPDEFETALPYPSFNTRDLNTVDNGCLKHIPDLMDHLRGFSTNATLAYEVLVVHFLGVDHVGHTYGPHNHHMTEKLRQMDNALTEILDRLDASPHCHTTLIMGDHGMTPDGNHGGGTEEETHAALFIHTSPGCGPDSKRPDWHLESVRRSELVQQEFEQVNQIDLVPTISVLLGLPIPYANLGSLVPSFLPGTSAADAATGLALNAAQVWRYFGVYSQTANQLPHLNELKTDLDDAVEAYRTALKGEDGADDDLFLQSATLFKNFLHKALDLGQRVWTRFDVVGMTVGISILAIGLLIQGMNLLIPLGGAGLSRFLRVEDVVSALFSVFTCGALTFSNSYILEEEHIIVYALAIISTIIALRIRAEPVLATIWRGILLIPVASRASGLFVTGHGMDPSLGGHGSHHPLVFISSLAILGVLRWTLIRAHVTHRRPHAVLDCAILTSLAVSWWEKRQTDPDRNGFLACRIAFGLWAIGIVAQSVDALLSKGASDADSQIMQWVINTMIVVATVTGPSSASSLVFFSYQMVVIFLLSRWNSPLRVSSGTLAALWRLFVRHAFFATNHVCTLNRLQLSAAFVATSEFNFVTSGASLFVNTFGWEISGILFAYLCSRHEGRGSVWKFYGLLQVIEALASCISVSVLRRHLMVWDIYAPHFLFVSIFTFLSGFANAITAFAG